MRHAISMATVIVVQVWFGWYYAYYLAIAMVLTLLVARPSGLATTSPWQPKVLAVAAALALVAIAPVLVPYLQQRMAVPEMRRSLGESALYSADLLDYVRTVPVLLGGRLPWALTGEQSYWPGLVTILLGSLGFVNAWRPARRLARIPIVITATGFVLSLGPILHVAGHAIRIPLPYALLYYVIPGASGMRAPARLAVLVVLGASVLAGVGYESLRRILGGRMRPLAATGILLIMLAGSIDFSLAPVELPRPEILAPIYRDLASLPGHEPVLEIPVPATEADENPKHALRQYAALFHGKPRLDGVSGFVTPRYRHFRKSLQAFPADSALSMASSFGARWVVVHYADEVLPRPDRLAGQVAMATRLRLVAREGSDVLYRLEP